MNDVEFWGFWGQDIYLWILRDNKWCM